MAYSKKKPEPELPRHGECRHLQPDMANLSVTTGQPILGRCRFCKFAVLLSEKTTCKNFEK